MVKKPKLSKLRLNLDLYFEETKESKGKMLYIYNPKFLGKIIQDALRSMDARWGEKPLVLAKISNKKKVLHVAKND